MLFDNIFFIDRKISGSKLVKINMCRYLQTQDIVMQVSKTQKKKNKPFCQSIITFPFYF